METMTYRFIPDYLVSRHWTEAHKRAHYNEQHHLFIVEALNTPYEHVTDDMVNTWHKRGHRMASPSTGIGRKMQEELMTYRAEYAKKAEEPPTSAPEWCRNTRAFIRGLMRV